MYNRLLKICLFRFLNRYLSNLGSLIIYLESTADREKKGKAGGSVQRFESGVRFGGQRGVAKDDEEGLEEKDIAIRQVGLDSDELRSGDMGMERLQERYLMWVLGVEGRTPGYLIREEVKRKKLRVRAERRA